jgi:hypothetical protein
MKKVIATLKSVTPYSQSRPYQVEKLPKESAVDYEKRTWRERCHRDKDGIVFIPPLAFKNSLSETAKYLSIQISGKGKQTYTKHFEAGITVLDPAPIGIHVDEVTPEWLFVPPNGKRGGDKRVWKCFPFIPEWIADVTDGSGREGMVTTAVSKLSNCNGTFRYNRARRGKARQGNATQGKELL